MYTHYLSKALTAAVLFSVQGCAQWFPATAQHVSPNVYQLTATGNSFSSLKKLQLKIDSKAQKLCAPNRYRYLKAADFDVHKQEVYIDGVKQSSHYITLSRAMACDH